MTTPTAEQLAGWTPVRVDWRDGEPCVDWCHTDGERFDDPCFDQTIDRCLRNPARLLFRHQTPIATLGEVAAAGESVPPAGFVLHSSRCGSTLVSQMLARLASLLMIAEPGPLHSLLAARTEQPDVTEDQQVVWLRWMVAALGRARLPEQRRLVIKLDAWAVLQLRLLRRAFPATPWIFLYRDPIEVLVSQLGHRGFHMIPGCLPPAGLRLGADQPGELAPEDYMALVLGAMLEAAYRWAENPGCLLVNYRELPDAVASRIAPWFGLELGPAAIRDMNESAGWNAKNPLIPFTPDGAAKQQRAGERLRSAAQRWAEPPYRSLEGHRQAGRK